MGIPGKISQFISNALHGSNGGVRTADLLGDLSRNKFSDYLPWVQYIPELHCYQTLDNRYGYITEICPLTFQSEKECRDLQTLLSITFPKRTLLQFLITPEANCDELIDAYLRSKTRDDPLARKSTKEYAAHLHKGTRGMRAFHGIPVRNFRAFACLKTREPLPDDIFSIYRQTLSDAGLMPRELLPEDLVRWARELFNDPHKKTSKNFDPHLPLRKQIIKADTPIDFRQPEFRLGQRYGRVITPKCTPKTVDTITTNQLLGGFSGITDDTRQLSTPFIWSLNILFDDLKHSISTKANVTVAQKAPGSFAKAISRRVEEFSWALDVAEKERFFTVIPTLVIFGDSHEQVTDATSRAVSMWENHDFEMQEETTLAKPLFLASLPLGLYDTGTNITLLDRHFYLPAGALTRFLPVQGDFRGSSIEPVLAYVGRKGQFVGIDVFDERSNNHNFLVTAESGSGKSYNLNYLCSSYYAANAKVRITDLGGSYEKAARTNKGRYLDIAGKDMVINPFHSLAKDKADREADMVATSVIIGEMVYSASHQSLHETEWTLVKKAVKWVYDNGETVDGIDGVARYLKTFPALCTEEEKPNFRAAEEKAHEMAFNLHDFTSKGNMGRFFNGPTTFDISQDDFVVLELETLSTNAELFGVIIMQVMNSVTQDLYLSSRADQRFILFEEAWQYFKTGDQNQRIGKMIEEGYRRARKYLGSFGIVVQSPLDLLKFGPVGKVINNNAAYKFYLECSDYQAAVDEGLMKYNGLAIDLLASVKNNKPHYSEIFFETPFGRGVGRLAMDPWNYWVNTSNGREKDAFDQQLKQGKSPYEAIQTLSGVS